MNGSLKRILVVDDNAANLTLINGILSGIYKIYPLGSGEDALEFLEIQSPDLVLLDIEMPGMSGLDLFGIMKENPKLSEIPVIFLTGLDDMKSEAEAFKLGAADFIRKPVNDTIMLARIKMHLELAEYRRKERQNGN